MSKKYQRIETQVIHAGNPNPLIGGAVSMPVFQSSTFEYFGQEDYHDLKYIRLNNTPNHMLLHKKLAEIECGEDAVVTASGMAIISTALLALLKPGDHLLVQDCIYGGTYDFIRKDFMPLGFDVDFIDANNPESWAEKLKPATRMIWAETMTNPLLQVADLKSMVQFAKANNLISVIDNTFASPVNFQPLPFGFDLSLHSGTKYLNGHSDIVAGAAIGSSNMIKKIIHKLNHLGGSLDPHACFLLDRGIKTLVLRVRYQNQSAQKLAEFLQNHPAVKKVYYPGLKTHPGHDRAKQWFNGFGGMLSFEIKGDAKAADKCLQKLNLPVSAPSLGGVESLITRPSTTSHSGMSVQEREKMGVFDNLIRVSVGIEAVEDLIEDFDNALA